MDVAPVAAAPIPWESAAAPASTEDVFNVSVSSTVVSTTTNDDNWADFGGDVTSSATTTTEGSENDDSNWADFTSFSSAEPQSSTNRLTDMMNKNTVT